MDSKGNRFSSVRNPNTLTTASGVVAAALFFAMFASAYAADSRTASLTGNTPPPSNNPVVQALEKHKAFQTHVDSARYLEHVLSKMHATPDYKKGFGVAGRDQHDRHQRDLPDICQSGSDHPGLSVLNRVTWDGVTLDHTGTRPLIEGTDKNDLIIGTLFSDFIYGYAGEDIICADAGDDIVFGDNKDFASTNPGDGGDVIFGGPGDDTLYGGGNYDFIVGGAGRDTLLGGDSSDKLNGDRSGGPIAIFFDGFYIEVKISDLPPELQGDDFLVGMDHSDIYRGMGGNDTVNDFTYNFSSSPIAEFYMDYMEKEDSFEDSCHVFQNAIVDAGLGGCEWVTVH